MHLLDRRSALIGLFATTATALCPPAVLAQDTEGLRAIADGKGIAFGSAVDSQFLTDPAYAAQLVRECNIIVPRNALKWSATERQRKKFSFGEADAVLEFARQNTMAMRGHTLVWHTLPDWVKNIGDQADLEAAMRRHVEAVAGHFAGRISSWDVVNEPLEYGEPVLRASPFFTLMGESYIDIAFAEARKADAKAQLVLNETHLCKKGDAFAQRRKVTLDLLGRLQDRNVPIDAVGIQGHFSPGLDELDVDGFGAFCRELKARGLSVLITELDASCRFVTRIPGFTDEVYAAPFKDLIEVAHAEGNLTAVVLWGLTARGMKPSEPKGDNPDCKVRINLYDADDNPLPTRAAVETALQNL
jgi:endo-1,4-beta-xylanase